MTLTPEVLASAYVDAGCQRLIVHAEAVTHLHRTLGVVGSLGVAAGVALNPATPAATVRHVLDLVDLVLVMTVNPGFGGQRYLATMEPKVAEVRAHGGGVGAGDRRRGRRGHRRRHRGRSGRRPEPTCSWPAPHSSATRTGWRPRWPSCAGCGGGRLPRLSLSSRRRLAAPAEAGESPANRQAQRPAGHALLPHTPCVPSAGWLWRSWSRRYGTAAVDALADAVARAKGGEPLRPVTVVVPSNYVGVAARRALARRHGVAAVAFVTLYRLAELLGWADAGPRWSGADLLPGARRPRFRAALAEAPGLFAPVADQPSTVEALRRVHRELRDLDPGPAGPAGEHRREGRRRGRHRSSGHGHAPPPLVRRDGSHVDGHGCAAGRGRGRSATRGSPSAAWCSTSLSGCRRRVPAGHGLGRARIRHRRARAGRRLRGRSCTGTGGTAPWRGRAAGAGRARRARRHRGGGGGGRGRRGAHRHPPRRPGGRGAGCPSSGCSSSTAPARRTAACWRTTSPRQGCPGTAWPTCR